MQCQKELRTLLAIRYINDDIDVHAVNSRRSLKNCQEEYEAKQQSVCMPVLLDFQLSSVLYCKPAHLDEKRKPPSNEEVQAVLILADPLL